MKTSPVNRFKVSFVIPVYNVELYLDETVQSLLVQTIGFEKNCEIIFVNDGSTDESEEICLKYKNKYPENITYIKQKNAGPGEARNKGFQAASGEYINPIDSDDKLSSDAAQEACNFLDKHKSEIDVVGLKWEFFEARNGGHPLNYKFTSDKVIDLNQSYTEIQSSVAPAFFRREALLKHRFNPAVGRYAEDGRFMGEFMMEKEKVGVVVKPTYYYRKRHNQTSSQDKNRTDKFWYLETPKLAWLDMIEYSRRKSGDIIPKYIQYLIMYDLQWRFKMARQTVLTEVEQQEYKRVLYRILNYIDDEVIMAVNNIDIDLKLFLLNKKHRTSILEKANRKGSRYVYNDVVVYDMIKNIPTVHIEIIECKDDKLVIEGYYTGYLSNKNKLQFIAGGKKYPPNYLTKRIIEKKFLDDTVVVRPRFSVTLPLEAGLIQAKVTEQEEPIQLYFHRYSYLSHGVPSSYRVFGEWIILKTRNSIEIIPYSKRAHIKFEAKYLLRIAKRLSIKPFVKNFKTWLDLKKGVSVTKPGNNWIVAPIRNAAVNLNVIILRMAYYMCLAFKRREIWLISDRIMAADDSGEILFRYIMKHKSDNNIKVYFVLSKKSDEFQNIAKAGPVLNYGSLKHKMLFLLSDKVISSEATDGIVNAIGRKLPWVIDLYTFDFVFLQHGIIRDDISNWLHKYNKNIKMFVTSVKPEYKSIIEGNYAYDENVVKLTGLPRYDNLTNKPKNKIILMPTWRDNLAGPVDPKTGMRQYNPDFTDSEYYTFFNSLMHDERLLEGMRRQEIKGEFYIHPSFESQTNDFKGNDVFTIKEMPHDYPRAKSEARMMITDYSSVAFDFAYLEKPVIYAQFDTDTFYNLHTSETGYFAYDKDGFGPVTNTVDNTVKEIVEMLEHDFTMEDKYKQRVNKFFAFRDKDNSKRVYEEIIKL